MEPLSRAAHINKHCFCSTCRDCIVLGCFLQPQPGAYRMPAEVSDSTAILTWNCFLLQVLVLCLLFECNLNILGEIRRIRRWDYMCMYVCVCMCVTKCSYMYACICVDRPMPTQPRKIDVFTACCIVVFYFLFPLIPWMLCDMIVLTCLLWACVRPVFSFFRPVLQAILPVLWEAIREIF